MDRKEKDNNISLNKSYVKITIGISVVIIILMYLTQSFWMNTGINILFKEYNAEDILPNNDIPNSIFILSGNYGYISQWVNTSKLNCETDSEVRLLAYPVQEFSGFKNVVILDTIEGCKHK